MSDDLNPRQQRFVDEYVISGIGRAAAVKAGYSARSAHAQAARMMNNAIVRAKIEAAQAKAAVEAGITQRDVLRMLLETYTAASRANQYQAAVKAVELLGKHLAMFSDRIKLEPGRELTDEDLVAELAGNDAELAATLLALLGRANDKRALH